MLMKKGGRKKVKCAVCGEISELTICQKCQTRIQGEMLEKKQRIEKKGRPDKGTT